MSSTTNEILSASATPSVEPKAPLTAQPATWLRLLRLSPSMKRTGGVRILD
jgi:hypothetical protein